jgi:predicted nucleotidyltransferase
MHPSLRIDEATLARLCEMHRIRRLSLFGSQLKGTAGPDSDIDLLVEFEPGSGTTLLDMAQIEIELAELLGGRKVDVRTAEDLSRCFRDEVVRSAEPQQYVAGCNARRVGHGQGTLLRQPKRLAAERRDDAGTPMPSPGEVTRR